jgi:hypothetical protein
MKDKRRKEKEERRREYRQVSHISFVAPSLLLAYPRDSPGR